MVRRRFAADGKANKNETAYVRQCVAPDDSDQGIALKGYRKLFAIILLFIVIILFRIYVFDIITVMGDSMEANFSEGDVLIVKKFDTSVIDRYDVVIAKVGNQTMLKRVIALPGEVIQIVDGRVLVNNEIIDKNFDIYTDYKGVADKPYVLSEGEYFLLGDNRSESYDSRDYGAVNRSQIQGIVTGRILPIRRMGVTRKSQEASKSE